jgi:ketosteroid isomerase-like protein
MARDHVDMVRKGYEAFARGDLDAALDMMDPQIEAHDPPEVPDATVHRGREAVRRDWEETLDLFEDIEIEEIFERDEEIVLFVRYAGRGRESDAAVEALRHYSDRAQALAAAGLEQQRTT